MLRIPAFDFRMDAGLFKTHPAEDRVQYPMKARRQQPANAVDNHRIHTKDDAFLFLLYCVEDFFGGFFRGHPSRPGEYAVGRIALGLIGQVRCVVDDICLHTPGMNNQNGNIRTNELGLQGLRQPANGELAHCIGAVAVQANQAGQAGSIDDRGLRAGF